MDDATQTLSNNAYLWSKSIGNISVSGGEFLVPLSLIYILLIFFNETMSTVLRKCYS